MSAFLFGTSGRQLFGFHHEPQGPGQGCALLCQPWGTEYQFAHRTMRFLANRLSGAGRHVLRFDYSGTGDSWGTTTTADVDGWVDEIGQAANELRAIGGPGPLDLIGLRLGATLASRAAPALGWLGRVVLWDPIIDGVAWIDEIDALDALPVVEPTRDDVVELGQQTVSPAFRRSIAGITPAPLTSSDVDTLVLWTGYQAGSARWPASETEGVTVEHLPQPSPWMEDTAVGAGQIPVDAVARILAWVVG